MGEVVVRNTKGREEESSLHYLGLYKNQALNNYHVVLFSGHCVLISNSAEMYWTNYIDWDRFLSISEGMRIL